MAVPTRPRCSVNRRLQPQSGEVIDRSTPLKFTWNSKKHVGYAGDTIVSALLANNEGVFSAQ